MSFQFITQLVLDPTRFVAGAKQAQAAAAGLANGMGGATTQAGKLAGQLKTLAGAYGAMQAAQVIRDAVQVGLAFERQGRALATAVGGAREAASEMAFLRKETDRLGIVLNGTIGSYGKFVAASGSIGRTNQRELFLGVAEAAAALSLSQEEATGALNAFLQMASKGTVQAEELRGQLGERIPGAFDMAARAMGVSTMQLNKMLERGEVLSSDLLPKMAVELRKTFGADAAANVDSLTARVNRFTNAVDDAKVSFTGGFGEGLSVGLKSAKSGLEGVNDTLNTTGRLMGAIIMLEDKWLRFLATVAKAPVEVGKGAANLFSGGALDQAAIDEMVKATGTYKRAVVEVTEAQRFRSEQAQQQAETEEQFQARVTAAWKQTLKAVEDAAQAQREAALAQAEHTLGIINSIKEQQALAAALVDSNGELVTNTEAYEDLVTAMQMGIDITDGLSKAEQTLVDAMQKVNKEIKAREGMIELEKRMVEELAAELDSTIAKRQMQVIGEELGASLLAGIEAGIDAGFVMPNPNDLSEAERKKQNAKLKEDAEQLAAETQAMWDGVADAMGGAFGNAFADMLRTGEVNFGQLAMSIIDIWIDTLADMFAKWVATQLKMQAVQTATTGGGGGGGAGGINAGSLGGMTGGASASTLAVLGVFAVAVYAWYNDRQHEYEAIEGAIRDIEKVFDSLSDTLGQYLPNLAGSIQVRKDGDRFRARVGFDDGGAGYAYFDEYADAIGASILSGLREQLDNGSVFGPGTLGHLGEEARNVIEGITDEIINMGQAGVEWLEEGLALARQLDQLGMSEMERTLADLRVEYEQNIRKAGEYGLSLQKVGALYLSQLADLENSLRDRIAQYLPGYDPVGSEFEDIRRDNAAIQAEYERMRQAIQAQIAQIVASIETLSTTGSGGGAAGGIDQLMQVFEDLARLMGSELSLSSGWGAGEDGRLIVETYTELMAELDRLNAVTAGGGGGLAPDVADRIAAQRKILEDLMRQLSLIPAGLTEEEIAQAEREARRRNRRGGGNRAQEREQFEDSLQQIIDSGLPDLIGQLVATQQQIAEVTAEAARLGANGDLAAAALEVLNQQLVSQAGEAFLSLGERMAGLLGDEEALAELAEIRYDLELAQMGVQIAMLEESGLLQEEQVQRLWDLYNRLPTDMPGDPTSGGENLDPLPGFGFDIGAAIAAAREFDAIQDMLDQIAAGGKVAIPALDAVRAELDGMTAAGRQFVADQAFLQLGDQLMAFIDRYGIAIEGQEDFRRQLEQIRYTLEIANMRAQIEMLLALELITLETAEHIRGILNGLPTELPDGPRGGGGGYGGYEPPDTSAQDERDRKMEQLLAMLKDWRDSALSAAERQLQALYEQRDEAIALATELGYSIDAVLADFNIALGEFWEVQRQGLRDIYDALTEGDASGMTTGQQLDGARQRYEELMARLRANPQDLDALGDIDAAAAEYLALLQEFTGGVGPLYARLRDEMRAQIGQYLGLETVPGTGRDGGGLASDYTPPNRGERLLEEIRDGIRSLAGESATVAQEARGQRAEASAYYRREVERETLYQAPTSKSLRDLARAQSMRSRLSAP